MSTARNQRRAARRHGVKEAAEDALARQAVEGLAAHHALVGETKIGRRTLGVFPGLYVNAGLIDGMAIARDASGASYAIPSSELRELVAAAARTNKTRYEELLAEGKTEEAAAWRARCRYWPNDAETTPPGGDGTND